MRIFTSLDVDQIHHPKITLHLNHVEFGVSEKELDKLIHELSMVKQSIERNRNGREVKERIEIPGYKVVSPQKLHLHSYMV